MDRLDSRIKGDNPDSRIAFANAYRQKLLNQKRESINNTKKNIKTYLTGNYYPLNKKNGSSIGAFLRPNYISLKTSTPINNNNNVNGGSSCNCMSGKGRVDNSIFQNALNQRKEFFETRNELKSGLNVVKEDENKVSPGINKTTTFEKMMDEIIDNIGDGSFKEIKNVYIRNTYLALKKDFKNIDRKDLLKYANFIASLTDLYLNPIDPIPITIADRKMNDAEERVNIKSLLSYDKNIIKSFFKILNLIIIILGNENKTEQEMKTIIDSSSKILNVKTPQEANKLFEELINKYGITIQKYDLTDIIENGIMNMVDKKVSEKQIDASAIGVRKKQTRDRTGTYQDSRDLQLRINNATQGVTDFKDLDSGQLFDFLTVVNYDKISGSLPITFFGQKTRVNKFLEKIIFKIIELKKNDFDIKTNENEELDDLYTEMKDKKYFNKNIKKAISKPYEDELKRISNPILNSDNFDEDDVDAVINFIDTNEEKIYNKSFIPTLRKRMVEKYNQLVSDSDSD